MKRIVMGRIGVTKSLDTLVARLRTYYHEVDSGKRVKTQSEISGSGNKLIDLWRTEYKS